MSLLAVYQFVIEIDHTCTGFQPIESVPRVTLSLKNMLQGKDASGECADQFRSLWLFLFGQGIKHRQTDTRANIRNPQTPAPRGLDIEIRLTGVLY